MQVKLKVLKGKSAGKEITVPVRRFSIGRAEDCHLRPKSDAISRNHCVILTNAEEVVLRDQNSRNGTFLNGERVTQDEALASGDVIQIGKMQFEVVIKTRKPAESAPAADTPTDQGESDSIDFDVAEWLDQEVSPSAKSGDPETRQFQLDETDRIALSGEESADADDDEDGSKKKAFVPPNKKQQPGKLPERPSTTAATSRDAAADMLKKFFNSR